MKSMSVKDVNSAVKNIANYYRSSRLYTYLANADDAYQYYIDSYMHDTECIVEQGFSYYNKSEYLIALRLELFEQQYPDEFHHYFDCIYSVMESTLSRESADVLFICAIGPSNGFFTKDTYKLVGDFVSKYQKDYTIITDCPVEIDIPKFAQYTNSQLVRIAGREYFRWAKKGAN